MRLIIPLAILAVCLTVCSGNYTDVARSIPQLEMESDPSPKECRSYHSLKNSTEICHFISSAEDCQMDEGFVNYINFALCHVKPEMLPGVYVLYGTWHIYLFIALGTTAESFFCPALEFIAHNLKLSQNIAGITVVAFGNGAPDIFSAVAAFTNSNPSSSGVAIGALLGAGVFVTTIVAGSVAITTPFSLAQRPFLRDVIFYLAAVFWTYCLLYKGQIDLKNSLGFLAFYVVYVVVVLLGRYINQKIRKRQRHEEGTEEPNETTGLLGNRENINQRLSHPFDRDSEQEDWIAQPIRASHEHDREMRERGINSDEIDSVHSDGSTVVYSASSKVWSLINPFAGLDWKEMSFPFKAIEVLQICRVLLRLAINLMYSLAVICQAPIKFLCKLTVPVVSADPDVNDWSRTLTCCHCVLSPMFCVFAAKVAFVKVGVMPLWSIFLIAGATFATLVWLTSSELRRPKYYWVFAYVGFVASVLWTYCVANEIVNLLQTFGALINVSNVIMGLTFLAWGNSIGDTVADVTLAKQGLARMAISACFGGPFFNLIIGIGLPCTIAIITNKGNPIMIQFTAVEQILVSSLLFSLAFSFVAVPLRKFQMTKSYGVLLILLYVVYLPIVILAGIHIIDW